MEILLAELGSPKFQLQFVIVPDAMVDKSEKQVDAPKQTGLDLKSGVGNGFTTVIRGKESTQPKLFVTSKVVV